MGDLSGAHLSALVALAGEEPTYSTEYRNDPDFSIQTVKAVVGVYGVYDMLGQWEHDQIARPRDQITEKFLGASPMMNRKVFFEMWTHQLCNRGQELDAVSSGAWHE